MATLATVIPAAEDSERIAVPSARSDLVALLAQFDGNFNAASQQLGQAVDKIDLIVSALTQVAGMFEGGVGAEAVDGLKQAAGSLMTIQSVVKQRSGEIGTMHEAAHALRESVQDVARCLQVLDIYGMNVKITASGLQQFMDFADAMRAKLQHGRQDIGGLDAMIAALQNSLRQMRQTDQRLAAECAKVIPQVPDSLLREAGNLQQHHAGLTLLAQSIAIVARSIQTELYGAIQAIQIGDRVRQRLEHVVTGLEAADHARAAGQISDRAATQFGAVLAALCDASAAEFARDIAALLAALGRLQSQCANLAGLHRAQEVGGDNDMLARIEASVSDAHEMLQQLDLADREGLATLEMILRTVDEVAERAEAMAMLRLDVQHMAINIGLNCRTAERIGRPVMVIANEIRSYSNRLDTIAEEITTEQASLSGPCHRIRDQSTQNKHASSETLLRFITVIGECSQLAHQATATVEAETDAMQEALRAAMVALGSATEYDPQIRALGARLREGGTGEAAEVEDTEIAALQALLDALARTYTMVEEREVHNAQLPPGITGIALAQVQPPSADDDDDDGLF